MTSKKANKGVADLKNAIFVSKLLPIKELSLILIIIGVGLASAYPVCQSESS